MPSSGFLPVFSHISPSGSQLGAVGKGKWVWGSWVQVGLAPAFFLCSGTAGERPNKAPGPIKHPDAGVLSGALSGALFYVLYPGVFVLVLRCDTLENSCLHYLERGLLAAGDASLARQAW